MHINSNHKYSFSALLLNFFFMRMLLELSSTFKLLSFFLALEIGDKSSILNLDTPLGSNSVTIGSYLSGVMTTYSLWVDFAPMLSILSLAWGFLGIEFSRQGLPAGGLRFSLSFLKLTASLFSASLSLILSITFCSFSILLCSSLSWD